MTSALRRTQDERRDLDRRLGRIESPAEGLLTKARHPAGLLLWSIRVWGYASCWRRNSADLGGPCVNPAS